MLLEFSLNGNGSGNLINHWSINGNQVKDPMYHLGLSDAVVASRFLTLETSGSYPFNDQYICKRIKKFREVQFIKLDILQ